LDNPLLNAAVFAGVVAGIAQVVNKLVSDPTAKKANQINADRLEMERTKTEAELEIKRRDELRAERDGYKRQLVEAEAELDRWRSRCRSHGDLCQLEPHPPGPPTPPTTINPI